ncbi:MAG: GNAT family N-acetyltransferase, partial [Flavisolibacter sp.]
MTEIDNKHTYILETQRLRLRQFDLGDSEFIIELLNSPGWIEYIGDRNVKTKEQAETYLTNGP